MANKPKIKPRKKTEFDHVIPPYAEACQRPIPCANLNAKPWGVRELMAIHLEALAQISEESLDCLIESARIEKNEREINSRKRRGRISCRKWVPDSIITPDIAEAYLN